MSAVMPAFYHTAKTLCCCRNFILVHGIDNADELARQINMARETHMSRISGKAVQPLAGREQVAPKGMEMTRVTPFEPEH